MLKVSMSLNINFYICYITLMPFIEGLKSINNELLLIRMSQNDYFYFSSYLLFLLIKKSFKIITKIVI